MPSPRVPRCLSPSLELGPPPQLKGGGVQTRLRVRGWGSPYSDDWRESLELGLLRDVSQRISIWPSFLFYESNTKIFSLTQYGGWQYSNNFFYETLYFCEPMEIFLRKFYKIGKNFSFCGREGEKFWNFDFWFSACPKIWKILIYAKYSYLPYPGMPCSLPRCMLIAARSMPHFFPGSWNRWFVTSCVTESSYACATWKKIGPYKHID